MYIKNLALNTCGYKEVNFIMHEINSSQDQTFKVRFKVKLKKRLVGHCTFTRKAMADCVYKRMVMDCVIT